MTHIDELKKYLSSTREKRLKEEGTGGLLYDPELESQQAKWGQSTNNEYCSTPTTMRCDMEALGGGFQKF